MVGLFDSGSGGLTVLTALRKQAPNADVVYFGDIAHAPYGIRSAENLAFLTHQGVRVLKSFGAEALVSACNSVSMSVLAGGAVNMPFIEMSLPTAEYLKRYPGQRFLLIATPATIASGLYERAVQGIVSIDPLPIADLAGVIEFGEPEDVIQYILDDAFSSRAGERYDGLILGCTHYPLVRDSIAKIGRKFFGGLRLVDPAYPVADAVCRKFDVEGNSKTIFLISKRSDEFEKKARSLGFDYILKVIDL